MPYRHVTLYRLHDGVPDATVRNAISALKSLANQPGVVEWDVARGDNHDAEAGGRGTSDVIVQLGLFESRAAFERYRDSSHSAEAGAAMRRISEPLTADFWQFPRLP